MTLSSRTKARPTLSVVVVALGGEGDLRRCLEALSRQQSGTACEVIVSCDERVDAGGQANHLPGVRFLAHEGQRTFAELRALGCRQATGEVVGFLEDQCVPCGEWCEEVLRGHAGSFAAVGGAVEKETGSAISWAMYLCDYARYMNPMPEGVAHSLTDCNVSYKKNVLDEIGRVWAREFHENLVHEAFAKRGQSLWFNPHMVVEHQRNVGFIEALGDRLAFGRLFGCTRSVGFSRPRRILHVLLTPLLPALLLLRIGRHLARAKRHWGRSLRALPALVMLTIAWAFGELTGVITGKPAAFPVAGTRESNDAVEHEEDPVPAHAVQRH